MKKTIFLFTSLLLSSLLYAGDFDITKYGAIGDGKTLNTIFIQKAVEGSNSKSVRVIKNKTKGIKKIIDQSGDVKPAVAIK